MKSANVHVTAIERGWELRREGERYPTSLHATRRSAVRTALEIAAESRSEVVIHEMDGRVVVDDQGRMLRADISAVQ
jgi:hypothetical protein